MKIKNSLFGSCWMTTKQRKRDRNGTVLSRIGLHCTRLREVSWLPTQNVARRSEIFSFAVEAFRSGHPGGLGHLDRHDAVQLLHPPSDEGAEVDGGDVAAAATVVVVDVLQPARLQAVTGWQPTMSNSLCYLDGLIGSMANILKSKLHYKLFCSNSLPQDSTIWVRFTLSSLCPLF